MRASRIIARLEIQTAEGNTLSLILTLRPDAKMLDTVEGGGGERKGRCKALRARVPAFRLCGSFRNLTRFDLLSVALFVCACFEGDAVLYYLYWCSRILYY